MNRLEIQADRTSALYGLRLSDSFRQALKHKAHENGRSLNSEILFRLRKTIEDEEKAGQQNERR